MSMLEDMDGTLGALGGGKPGKNGQKKPDRDEEAMMADIMSSDMVTDKGIDKTKKSHKDEDILAGSDSEMPKDEPVI